MLRRVALVRTYVSEEFSTSIIRVTRDNVSSNQLTALQCRTLSQATLAKLFDYLAHTNIVAVLIAVLPAG
jgi:hypothetical protein